MECKLCNKKFTGLENYKAHEVSEKHKRKVALHHLQNNGTSNIFPTSEQASCGPVARDINTFPCDICSKIFYSLSDFMQHSVSEEHANMVLSKRLDISAVKVETPVCSSTAEDFSMNGSAMDNTDSVSQLNISSGLLNQSGSVNPYYVRCEPCDKNFSGPGNYEQHIVSNGHRKKCGLQSSNVSQKENQKVIVEEIVSSNAGDKSFNNTSSFQQHDSIDSTSKMLAESCSVKVNSNNNCMNSLICEICNMTFTGPIPHNQHLQSQAHKKGIQRKQLLMQMDAEKENRKAETVADSSTKPVGPLFLRPWFCETCNKICSGPDPFKAHMASEKHKKKFAKAVADGKQNEIRSIMSQPPGEVDIFSNQRQATEDSNMTEVNNGSLLSLKPDQEIKGLFQNETSSLSSAVDVTDLNMTFFKVGEEIDFDKKDKGCINISELELNGIDEDEEETTYDDMPSP